MPSYKCTKPGCPLQSIVLIRPTKLIIRNGQPVDTGAECPKCKHKCESVRHDGFCVNFKSENIPNK